MQIISVSRSSENPMLPAVSRLRCLLRNALRKMKLPIVILSPDVAKTIHDVDLRSVVGGQCRADQPHRAGDHQSEQPNFESHAEREKRHLRAVNERKYQQLRQARTDESADQS